MKLTQREKIARALKAGRTLTMLDCWRIAGTLNGHKRLDETGLPVERVWVKRAGRKLRGYRLVQQERAAA